ncbi:ABC-type spermidine/putrescine transport system permease subunit II [Rhodobacter aestuarii]|uniref:Spermidine/putrescine transport system permease protein n=1 Tax=Rhodobacter aestuarii TaxID=453582 RepID=A0A1N7MB77_9RHOB|nr:MULTISPECIES: ABC transporter permease [Rhodobacter]PTV94968.1 ABC-type spermidine/putrescine transport system permease subunit II [Rhodobacter aestuarii]SIS83320.1 spermidine/putrescine transport system permease protein [Rhodobacter aestuarii]SOB97805.1 ABC-type spermidine/putrescine transport system permease subunit II [Rhodobacter sp. JA431]
MKFSGLRLYALLYLLFLYAPILLLPVFAFNDGTVIAFPLKGFTLEWFGQMASNDTLGRALVNSLIIALSTAILSTTLGIFAARSATRYHYAGKAGVMGLIMLPLVLPEIIVAVSLLVVLLGMGMTLSIFTVILGHVLIATPYAIAVLNAAFSTLDQSLEEAAYDLGETKWSTFRLIILPLVTPGIISSALMAFTISLDEFIIAFFLAGEQVTLPTYIYSQLRFPKQIPMIMALGTVLVLASVILLTLAEYFRRRGLAKTGAKDTGGFL